tara:strand:+ start:1817 stop:2032 length:216 start_codon:yes stop_codon:yes gene_type:complete
MLTRRYANDKNGKKVYVGTSVKYKNLTYLIEDIQYLSWNRNQYLTLLDKKNKNKKVDFVLPSEVSIQYKKR